MHLQPRGRGRDWASQAITKRQHSSTLAKRELSGSRWAVIVVAALFAVLVVVFVTVVIIRKTKKAGKHRSADKKQPGFLNRLFGSSTTIGGQYQQASGEEGTTSHALSNTNAQPNSGGPVNRNTSIRSVITLPAYRQAPSHEERVLGYEGDRDGVDVIVDMPTAEDEEELREREMSTLYQIREARRQNQVEREEHRRQREEAQARNDSAALRALRANRPRGNSNREQIREMREEVERIKENRQRSVSSVSYAGLGITHHDGSRVRANSNESERMGLLSDAASMATASRAGASSPQPSHLRGRSASSIISLDSDLPSPGLTRTNGSGSNTPRASIGGTRAGSSPELVEADLGDEVMRPPEYEDVPLDGDGRGSPFDRSTTPLHEPPPNYPGPYRTNSQTSTHLRSQETLDSSNDSSRRSSRGVGGTPQLPSLRLGRLPSIVIEPSSAVPRDEEH